MLHRCIVPTDSRKGSGRGSYLEMRQTPTQERPVDSNFAGPSVTEAVEQGLGVAQMSASTEVYVRDDMPPNVSVSC